MAKEIRTMTGATYVVTMTEAGTVKGVYNAQEIVLVSLEHPPAPESAPPRFPWKKWKEFWR